jgi:malate synthase
MGGMAAQIPIKTDPEANERALDKVRQDKLREVKLGHDGTWVAHPGLVPIAKQIFDEHMQTPNQIGKRPEARIAAEDLLEVPRGTITEAGLRWNIDVDIQYLSAWLGGNGCVPIYNLMEDAATAEICRSQVWQWVKHGARMDDGRPVTAELVRQAIEEQAGQLKTRLHRAELDRAVQIYQKMMTSPEFPEFLTLAAYDYID